MFVAILKDQCQRPNALSVMVGMTLGGIHNFITFISNPDEITTDSTHT